MRVFVTGATGYIGSAVVQELVAAGHRVTGLSRSTEGIESIRRMGADALQGDMREPATYEPALASQDALVHAGFDYSADSPQVDATLLETFLRAAGLGTARALVYTSGVWVLGDTRGKPAAESASTAGAPSAVAWRPPHERRVVEAAGSKLATAVIRPGIVYGGGAGLVSQFFATAASDGFASYIGDGRNRWPLVHRDDVARLYRLVLESLGRGIFHAVDGLPTTVIEAARAASAAAGRSGSTRRVPLEEARKRLGAFADAMCLDQLVVAPRSAELGWKPEHAEFRACAPAVYEEWKATRGRG